MDSPRSCQVGALSFAVTTLDRAVAQTLEDGLSRRSVHVHLANAWSIALAAEDNELAKVFRLGQNYPDGKPVVWAMSWLDRSGGLPRPTRVYGPTFFERTLETGVDKNVRHYFLGSTPETLRKLESNLRSRFPEIEIVGSSSPPFKEFTSEDFALELSKIEAAQPHIIWVGLGTPKQDKAAAYLADRYEGVFACVGAAFDFTAGNLRDVPLWVQEAGFAWLYRFAQEPKRLWRRYTYGNAKFISIVISQLIRGRRDSKLRNMRSR